MKNTAALLALPLTLLVPLPAFAQTALGGVLGGGLPVAFSPLSQLVPYSSGTKFTASGCSNSTTVGGPMSGTFASGTTGTCTVTITIAGATGATAPNGWICLARDRTTPADVMNFSASSATTCAITGTTVSGDVIEFIAFPY